MLLISAASATTIHGYVTTGRGSAVQGATVSIDLSNYRVTPSSVSALSGRDGYYNIEVTVPASDTYEVTASKSGYSSSTKSVAINPSSDFWAMPKPVVIDFLLSESASPSVTIGNVFSITPTPIPIVTPSVTVQKIVPLITPVNDEPLIPESDSGSDAPEGGFNFNIPNLGDLFGGFNFNFNIPSQPASDDNIYSDDPALPAVPVDSGDNKDATNPENSNNNGFGGFGGFGGFKMPSFNFPSFGDMFGGFNFGVPSSPSSPSSPSGGGGGGGSGGGYYNPTGAAITNNSVNSTCVWDNTTTPHKLVCPETKSNFPWLLLVIVIAIVSYYLYNKYKGK